ncbi:YceI family protein [Draconibacterium sp.]|jgi:polyisoprenoid-binding protein YceI
MKKTIGLLAAVLITASTVLATNIKDEKSAFEIDTKASKVYWKGKKVTGEHTGYVAIDKGQIWVEKNNVVGAEVNMDMNSIVCTDLKDDGTNKKLVGHLKSDDFFSVEKHPTAKFEITSMTKANKAGEYNVKGNMTIKGASHEINFPAQVAMENGKVKAKGTAVIDRTKWKIQYGSGKFFEGLGDKMIYDDFEITFDISAKVNTELTEK